MPINQEDLAGTLMTFSCVVLDALKKLRVGYSAAEGEAFLHAWKVVGHFMGVTGVHPDAGLSTGDAEEAAVKRALHERAAETVVLASTEKLMAASPFLVAALAEITLLVVPTKTPDRIARALRTGGVKVERAK